MVLGEKPTKETEMKRQRNGKPARVQPYYNDLLHGMGKFLPRSGLPLQVEDHRVRWTPRILVTTAILMGWAVASTCQEAFEIARQAAVGMYPTRRRPGGTYLGFIKALQRKSVALLRVVATALRRATRRLAADRWRENGWVVMCVDGSRVDCPRTQANEKAFGYSGKKRSAPQQTVTTLFHVGSGLPWAWTRGHARADEVAQLRAMLGELPRKTMLLADAFYTSYDLLRSLVNDGHRFVVRVGRNVSLLRKLGYATREYEGLVYLWPQAKQKVPGNEPLVLRLVKVGGKRQPVYLLTNEMDESILSDGEVGRLYQRRWGIEVMYRSLKQTLDHAKMRSDKPDSAQVELDWAMAGLWMLGLMTLESMPVRRRSRGWSVAQARRAVRRAMGNLPQRRGAGRLRGQLRHAVPDSYRRGSSKTSRDYPRKKRRKPPGPPNIRTATRSERQRAKALEPCQAAA